jgi:hypothetical protein
MTPKQFRTLFAILHNLGLHELAEAGVIGLPENGSPDWLHFNNNVTTFVLKLPEDRFEKLVALVHTQGLQP